MTMESLGPFVIAMRFFSWFLIVALMFMFLRVAKRAREKKKRRIFGSIALILSLALFIFFFLFAFITLGLGLEDAGFIAMIPGGIVWIALLCIVGYAVYGSVRLVMDRSPELAHGTSGESAAEVLVEHLYRVNRVEFWIALVVLVGVVLIVGPLEGGLIGVIAWLLLLAHRAT